MEILSRYRDGIVRALAAALAEEGPLGTLVRYPVGFSEADGRPGPGVGGKLLRPALACFACEALGREAEAALPLGVALELVHNFSLVHDDIQDGDEVRRGRPSAWTAFGRGQAINAGDALLVAALRTPLAAKRRLSAETLLEAEGALLRATLRMIEGQALDLGMEGALRGGVEAYAEVTRRKTGALFGCALELGTIAADRPDLRDAHRGLGETIGVLFQIQDDVLGIWGNAEKTGKPVGGDLRRHKPSWPLSFALERDPSLVDVLGREPLPVEEVLARLGGLGAWEAAEAEVARLSRDAERSARGLPWSAWARGAFLDLLSFLAVREA